MDKPLIYSLIPKIMADVGPIAKGRRNAQQGYQFRGIDDVYNTLQPVLVAHGVFVVPEIIDERRETKTTQKGTELCYVILKVKHTFYASDGSSITAITIGEAMDSGDKASNKAMSAAMKYALIEVFCIPTEGDNDTENQTHEVVAKPPAVAQQPIAIADDDRAKIDILYLEKWTAEVAKRGHNEAKAKAALDYALAKANAKRPSDVPVATRQAWLGWIGSGSGDKHLAAL